jgi:coiled-coil domain-containing protein 130
MQGFNMGRYYPPDADNPPSFNKSSHPLGSRAKDINKGVLTVRFELPFAVWCESPQCKGEVIVGQGVRFNAQKKKVGNYHSTPIWSFRMKHTACGGWWEIRTDPQNSRYVVVEGARQRDYGPEVRQLEGELAFLTPEEREKRREDAFAMFEGKKADREQEAKGKERVEELLEASEMWRDPYTANQKLRREFRVKRKLLEGEERVKEGLQDKFSLGLEIAGETEADGVRAGLVEFGAKEVDGDVVRRGLFDKEETKKKEVMSTKGKLKSEIAAEKSRKSLQQSLVGNTKAAIDPFLSSTPKTEPKTTLRILKRKRTEEPGFQHESPLADLQEKPPIESTGRDPPAKALPIPLVDYDSD